MSRLTTRGRKRIAGKNFVFPRGTKASGGEPKFPIHDRSHASNALARAGQKKTKLTKKERCAVVKKVCKKFPTMGLCETGKVSAKSALKRAGCGLKTKKKMGPHWITGTFRIPKSERGLERSMKVLSVQRF